jgi:hypothetical protein
MASLIEDSHGFRPNPTSTRLLKLTSVGIVWQNTCSGASR